MSKGISFNAPVLEYSRILNMAAVRCEKEIQDASTPEILAEIVVSREVSLGMAEGLSKLVGKIDNYYHQQVNGTIALLKEKLAKTEPALQEKIASFNNNNSKEEIPIDSLDAVQKRTQEIYLEVLRIISATPRDFSRKTLDILTERRVEIFDLKLKAKDDTSTLQSLTTSEAEIEDFINEATVKVYEDYRGAQEKAAEARAQVAEANAELAAAQTAHQGALSQYLDETSALLARIGETNPLLANIDNPTSDSEEGSVTHSPTPTNSDSENENVNELTLTPLVPEQPLIIQPSVDQNLAANINTLGEAVTAFEKKNEEGRSLGVNTLIRLYNEHCLFVMTQERPSSIGDRAHFHLYHIQNKETPGKVDRNDGNYGATAMLTDKSTPAERLRSVQRVFIETVFAGIEDAVKVSDDAWLRLYLNLLENQKTLDAKDLPKNESKNNVAHLLFKRLYNNYLKAWESNKSLVHPHDPAFKGDFGRTAFANTANVKINAQLKLDVIKEIREELKQIWTKY